MSEFMVHHTHGAEECERIFSEFKNVDQSLNPFSAPDPAATTAGFSG